MTNQMVSLSSGQQSVHSARDPKLRARQQMDPHVHPMSEKNSTFLQHIKRHILNLYLSMVHTGGPHYLWFCNRFLTKRESIFYHFVNFVEQENRIIDSDRFETLNESSGH